METVYDKLRRNAYRNTDPYPQSPARPIPVFSGAMTAAELKGYATQLERWEQTVTSIKLEQDAWSYKNSDLESRFRNDLEEENGMVGHPKSDLLYWKAYERGHSGGVDEVYSAYMDMLELVQ